MSVIIKVPRGIMDLLRSHLFQSDLEQGGFLFAHPEYHGGSLRLIVKDIYLVYPQGWEIQSGIYLQMKDSERAKIFKIARDRSLCVIDCHSHPHARDNVWFSPSDVTGITNFAEYAKWKLNDLPFSAMVWGESSVDAVTWWGDFKGPEIVKEIHIIDGGQTVMTPTGSWFRRPKGRHRFESYE